MPVRQRAEADTSSRCEWASGAKGPPFSCFGCTHTHARNHRPRGAQHRSRVHVVTSKGQLMLALAMASWEVQPVNSAHVAELNGSRCAERTEVVMHAAQATRATAHSQATNAIPVDTHGARFILRAGASGWSRRLARSRAGPPPAGSQHTSALHRTLQSVVEVSGLCCGKSAGHS